jgi:hypothetical protein
MWRRLLVVVSVVAVIAAAVMVVVAAKGPGGAADALGVWGFVLAAIGVVLAAVGLWPAGRDGELGSTVQINHADEGDIFAAQNGDLHTNSDGRKKRRAGG